MRNETDRRPIVAGGQGRTAQEVVANAGALAAALLGALIATGCLLC